MTEHNWNHFVDPTPTRLHLARLRAAGMSWAHIAELSGIHRDTLRNIDDTRRVETLTEESVLAVQPAAPEGRGANRAGPGSARRLQALIAIGWPLRWIGRHLGIDSRNLWRVVYQRAAVTGSTAAKIARTYDALWDKKPPTGTTRERIAVAKALGMARRNGWVPPLAWDEDIDDPAARPHIGEGRAVWGTLVENVEFLAAAGEKLPAIAARVGRKAKSVTEELYRANRRDLVARIMPELNQHTKGRAA